MSQIKLKGFTVIELMVAMAVFIILLSVGVPSFVSFIQRYSAESTIGMFHKDLHLARSEAVSLGKPITLCHLSSSNVCDGKWLEGITIFVDDGAEAGKLDDGELVLVKSNPMGTENHFTGPDRTRITYNAEGQSPGFNGTFVFCPSSGEAEYARGVILSAIGRARATSDQNSDGTHEGANGKALTCS